MKRTQTPLNKALRGIHKALFKGGFKSGLPLFRALRDF